GNWSPASVTGTVWQDANRNGFRDGSEAGLAGATVYVDYNGNGLRDPGEPYATSAASGGYTIAGVKPGPYSVRQEPPAGYVCTHPGGCAYANVAPTAGPSAPERDVGYTPTGRLDLLLAEPLLLHAELRRRN